MYSDQRVLIAGATTCVSGSVCSKQNDYYSQCMYVFFNIHGLGRIS